MKKPSLADVALASPDDDEPAEDEASTASLDELADALDVPEDKRDSFASAFKAAVLCCK